MQILSAIFVPAIAALLYGKLRAVSQRLRAGKGTLSITVAFAL
jgi:hypothetical protein